MTKRKISAYSWPDDLFEQEQLLRSQLSTNEAMEALEVLYWRLRLPSVEAVASVLNRDITQSLFHLNRLDIMPASTPSAEGRHGPLSLMDRANFLEDSLPRIWGRAVAAYGERPFIINDEDGSVFTYKDADSVIMAIARRLQTCGIQPRDRIVVRAPYHPEAIFVFWACVHIGVSIVPIDHTMPAIRSREIIAAVKPSLIFTDFQFAEEFASTDNVLLLDSMETSFSSMPNLSEWLRDDDFCDKPVCADENWARYAGVMIFTSGTTQKAKGVVLPQGALANSGRLMAWSYGWKPDDILLSLSGFHSISGIRNPCIAAVIAGAATVVAREKYLYNVSSIMACADRHRVTLLAAAPITFQLLTLVAKRSNPNALKNLRWAISTGSRLAEQTRAEFMKRFNIPLSNQYGLTEMSGLCVGDRLEELSANQVNVGRPLDVLLRIVDETENDVASGVTGEIWIQSANHMLGYFDAPKSAHDAYQDRWYRTGDLGYRDADGICHVVGRKSQFIKNFQGDIVALAEVKEALITHPKVADAAIRVATDNVFNERIETFVVLKKRPLHKEEENRILENIWKHVLGLLGPKKTPATICFVKEIPSNL